MERQDINSALRLARGYVKRRDKIRDEATDVATLWRVSDALGAHGVECISDRNSAPVAYYINTGQTYDLTLIYDRILKRFVVESWGDFVERKERTAIVRGGFRTQPDGRTREGKQHKG